MSHFKDVNVVSLPVQDWERAKKFYADVLGWPVAFASDEAGWVEYGEEGKTHLSIERVDAGHAGHGGGATPVLTVVDAHAVTADLRSKGVRCDEVITIPGMVTYGAFYDPEGNRIQFASMAG